MQVYRSTYNLKINGAFSGCSPQMRFIASFRGEEGKNGSIYVHYVRREADRVLVYIFGSRIYFIILLGPLSFQFLFGNLQKGFCGGGWKLSHGNFEVFRISKISTLRFLRDG